MSDSSTAAILWMITGAAWLTVWRACVRAGIRTGATLHRDAIIAATRGSGLTPPTLVADASIARAGLAAMISVALVVPLLYAASPSALDPIGTWWGVASGAGIAGALISAWEGVRIGWRRQAAVGAGVRRAS
jgi:hypothetical protein